MECKNLFDQGMRFDIKFYVQATILLVTEKLRDYFTVGSKDSCKAQVTQPTLRLTAKECCVLSRMFYLSAKEHWLQKEM